MVFFENGIALSEAYDLSGEMHYVLVNISAILENGGAVSFSK